MSWSLEIGLPAPPVGPADDLPSAVVVAPAVEAPEVALGDGLPREGVGVVAPEKGVDGLEVVPVGLLAPRPVPIVEGPMPGPEGLCPPVVVIFCPKKPKAGRA